MPVWRATVEAEGRRVAVVERPERGGLLVLRWYERGKPRTESLRLRLRDSRGRVDPAIAGLAKNAALAKAMALADGSDLAMSDRLGLTLGQTERRVFDPRHGLYPTRTSPHHQETLRALRYAVAFWGEERPWATIRRSDLRALWRQRIRDLHQAGHRGVRGAEVTVQRLLTVARWLQDEELVPVEAVQPGRAWKRDLRADWKQITGAAHDPAPAQPRHTPEEMNRIIEVAPQVDPRFALMLQLGAELRLGQVRRLMRSHVVEMDSKIVVPSSGRKRGTTVYLTDEQRGVLVSTFTAGYLRNLELARKWSSLDDYPLFPSGRLQGYRAEGGETQDGRRTGYRLVPDGLRAPIESASRPPISRTAVRDWFREAERLAGIPHRKGRGTYGLRRAGVDGAKAEGIDRDALKAFGGWSDTQMPDRVYADAEQEAAAKRARDVRAKVRSRR